ncbi:MAG: A/G-specific adenine glycosylase [Oscillospiraceae bacterium]|nr:A/G-specific adenine glycosylase [Oscillospiraceae bacterium]
MKNITEPLLQWYRANRRELPWRQEPTAYRVWVSEIMLQQTRIEAAKGYFERFMAALPDVYALAEADEETVLKLWEGLGYYSRARNLHKTAKRIVSEYGGTFPGTAAELRKLPGIGDYTAGAIASIAFDQRESAVDGNVLRVYSRLERCGESIGEAKLKKRVGEELRAIYPETGCGDFTSALMELGETVCLPGTPRCLLCPLAELCAAHAAGEETLYPVMPEKKKRRTERRNVLLYIRGDTVALRKRPDGGLLAGLWEYPDGDVPAGAESCGSAKHIFTHVEWHMEGYICREAEPPAGCIFVTAAERRALAIPTAFRFYNGLLESMGY